MAKTKSKPVLKLRIVLWALLIVSTVLSGPLLVVWKQAYINTASLQLDLLSDSLSVLEKQITTVKMECEKLSSRTRIEHIARTVLNLDYPTSEQIVIVPYYNVEESGFASAEQMSTLASAFFDGENEE
ncbi:cell division protein FtsL [Chitinispirillales bacterium ANBcel5]|uniref:cell division protein FtsL n=1 Tax=Cellulosispirillum alkaliphilum TaxID=3039283 RepID=UPI002A4E3C3D|nr:cell division protein FtsL [Chitinispirillales bacterium ANBcel5]